MRRCRFPWLFAISLGITVILNILFIQILSLSVCVYMCVHICMFVYVFQEGFHVAQATGYKTCDFPAYISQVPRLGMSYQSQLLCSEFTRF